MKKIIAITCFCLISLFIKSEKIICKQLFYPINNNPASQPHDFILEVDNSSFLQYDGFFKKI
ncbi:MAG: hypothetical protein ACR2KX_03435 [Chitinophagaceae bacterium]